LTNIGTSIEAAKSIINTISIRLPCTPAIRLSSCALRGWKWWSIWAGTLCKIVLWWGVNNRSWSCRLFLLLPRNIFHWLPCLLWPWIPCRLRVDILLRSLLWPWVSCRLLLDFLLRSRFRTGLWSWFRLCDRLTWLLLHIWSWVGRLDRCYGTCTLTNVGTSVKAAKSIVNAIEVRLANTPAVGFSSSTLRDWRNGVNCRTRALIVRQSLGGWKPEILPLASSSSLETISYRILLITPSTLLIVAPTPLLHPIIKSTGTHPPVLSIPSDSQDAS